MIVLNTTDTLYGSIAQKEWALNPEKILFKKDNGNAKEYTIDKVRYFEITDGEHFERHKVRISMDDVNISSYNRSKDTSSRVSEVLLKIVNRGPIVTLFSYTDQVKTRFYLQEGLGAPLELYYSRYVNSSQQIVYNRGYQTQLLTVTEKSGNASEQLNNRITAARYELSDIQKITEKINGNNIIVNKGVKTKFFGGISFVQNNMKFKDLPLGQSLTESSSITLSFFTGVDVILNPVVGRWIFRTELAIGTYAPNIKNDYIGQYDWNNFEMNYSFRQYTASLVPKILYNFYSRKKLKLFACAGYSFNVSQYGDQQITRILYDGSIDREVEKPELRRLWTSIPVGAGISLKRNMEFSLNYTLPAEISVNHPYYIGKAEALSVRFNYFLK